MKNSNCFANSTISVQRQQNSASSWFCLIGTFPEKISQISLLLAILFHFEADVGNSSKVYLFKERLRDMGKKIRSIGATWGKSIFTVVKNGMAEGPKIRGAANLAEGQARSGARWLTPAGTKPVRLARGCLLPCSRELLNCHSMSLQKDYVLQV